MDRIEVIVNTMPGERLVGARLSDLLRDWIDRTSLADDLVDVSLTPSGDEAVARLAARERTLEVRLHHEGDPESHRVTVEASTWVVPSLPSPGWAWGAGALAGLAGLILTLGFVGSWFGAVIMGLVASTLLAALVANLVWRGIVRARIRDATEAAGGQVPASDYLAQLDQVVRSDARVARVTEL